VYTPVRGVEYNNNNNNNNNVCHAPGARMVWSAFHFTKAVVSQIGALRMGLQSCGD